jgi:SPOR domain
VPYVLDIVNPPVVRKTASAPPRPAPSPAAPKATTPEPAPPVTPPASVATPPPAVALAPSVTESAKSLTPATTPPTAATPAPTPTPAPTAAATTTKKSAEATRPTTDTRKSTTDSAKMTTAAVEPPKPTAARKTVAATSSAPYWVQVGAFKDETTAKKLAARLRDQNYEVQESVKGPTGASLSAETSGVADRYNVFVSGSTPADLTTKLSAKGLAADAVAGGVVVKPSLPLRDAVALSRDLAADGLRVQVRRAGGSAGAVAAAPSAPGGDTLHRVRVSGLPDRAAAQAVVKELEGKGYKPFIGRGGS